jgi:hypothetical protein
MFDIGAESGRLLLASGQSAGSDVADDARIRKCLSAHHQDHGSSFGEVCAARFSTWSSRGRSLRSLRREASQRQQIVVMIVSLCNHLADHCLAAMAMRIELGRFEGDIPATVEPAALAAVVASRRLSRLLSRCLQPASNACRTTWPPMPPFPPKTTSLRECLILPGTPILEALWRSDNMERI